MSEDSAWRLSKKVASCTNLSRREASAAIKKGEVKVNSLVEKDPARVITESDIVTMGQKVLVQEKIHEYYLFNKPKNMMFEGRNDKNRPSVSEIMQKHTASGLSSLYTIREGMCGLVLLSDDENLIQKFTSGKPRVKQWYEVVFSKELDEVQLKLFTIILENDSGIKVKEALQIQKNGGQRLVVELYGNQCNSLYDAMLEVGLPLAKMDRIYFGGITKKDITRGWFRKMTEKEIILLKYFYNTPDHKKADHEI